MTATIHDIQQRLADKSAANLRAYACELLAWAERLDRDGQPEKAAECRDLASRARAALGVA